MILPSFRRFRLLCFLFLMSGSLSVQGQGTWVLKSFGYHVGGSSSADIRPGYRVHGMTYCHDYLNESNTGYFVTGMTIAARTSNAIIIGEEGDEWDGRVTDPEKIAQLKKDLFSDTRIKEVTETSITMNNGTHMTWTAPPKKVAFGSEKDIKVSVDFHLVEYPDVQVTGKVTLSRYDSERFYAFPDEQERKIEASETVELDASKSYKGSVWKDKHLVDPPYYHAPYYTLHLGYTCWLFGVGYTYIFVPDFAEVTTTASEDSGEDEDTEVEIPWDFILIGLAGVGAAGVLVSRNKKKKNKDNKNKNPNQVKQQVPPEEVPHSTFRMIVYKDFGDTLIIGDEPNLVGARIEETTPDGRTVERADLTAMIVIDGEKDCVVSNSRMQGRYRMANVEADVRSGSIDKAIVRFTFRGRGGLFVNHVVFQVQEAPVIVMDEALTFAACRGKTLEMQFGINNLSGRVVGLQAQIGDVAARCFYVNQPVADSSVPGKYVVTVTEIGTEQKEAGYIEQYDCEVIVQLEGRKVPLRRHFTLYRLHLGLRLELKAIKAYLVTFDSSWDRETPTMDKEIRKKFAESKVTFKLIVEDEENGTAASVLPDSDPVFTFQDIPEESLLFVDKYGNRVENPCQLMKIKYDFRGVYDDNTAWGVLYSTAGGLFPPNRGKAMVTVRVTWHGQVFEESIMVPIISQPFVDISDVREYDNWLKMNQKRYEELIELKHKIESNRAFADLSPFYYKVYAMVEGYHPDFGVYEPDYNRIMKIKRDYVAGKIGHYFANETAWHTGLSAADENFNAFMATFASMEKSIVVIGARIALAYFTAGASELVLTPMSAMVRMQERVNQGEDSALKCFAMASGEVLFWEGAFYLGGKAINKGAQFAKDRGYGEKIKDAFNKLKDIFTKNQEAKNATKKIVQNKGFSTSNLGNKVQKAGQKLKQTKTSAASRANEAIRRTRNSRDAGLNWQSEFAEEGAQWARKDAEKILEDFKRVMNNPTATPEEMRRVTLALQGNKAAQNLLRESQSDLLRATFNSEIKKIYSEVDPLTIKKLAKELNVPESDIRVWDGASANSGKDLYLGKKIGADRDVTFQVKGSNGEWGDIREDIMERCYAEAFTEYHYGFLPADRQQAIKTLRKFDQAVVNGETGLESFGKDLKNIIDKSMQTNKLVDADRVANTVKYKCEYWLNQGKACREQAEQLYRMGMIDEARHVMGYGEELVKEGVRMNVKEFKRILDPRIQALYTKDAAPRNYDLLYEKIKILESIGTPPPKDVIEQSLEQARLTLETQYGTTIEAVIEECTEAIREINPYL